MAGEAAIWVSQVKDHGTSSAFLLFVVEWVGLQGGVLVACQDFAIFEVHCLASGLIDSASSAHQCSRRRRSTHRHRCRRWCLAFKQEQDQELKQHQRRLREQWQQPCETERSKRPKHFPEGPQAHTVLLRAGLLTQRRHISSVRCCIAGCHHRYSAHVPVDQGEPFRPYFTILGTCGASRRRVFIFGTFGRGGIYCAFTS